MSGMSAANQRQTNKSNRQPRSSLALKRQRERKRDGIVKHVDRYGFAPDCFDALSKLGYHGMATEMKKVHNRTSAPRPFPGERTGAG
jgi:hypothetical protein